jgi:hypothetical protein
MTEVLDRVGVTTVKVTLSTRDRIKRNARGRYRTVEDYLVALLEEDERRQRFALAARQRRAASPDVMAAYRQEAAEWDGATAGDIRW